MNIELSRRSFMLGAGAGLAGTSLGALGFGEIEVAHALSIRPFRLAQTKEVRSQCPYCAVCCGMLIFAAESKQEKGKMEVPGFTEQVQHLLRCCGDGTTLHSALALRADRDLPAA